jgi:HAD superfamily hydrolase (TIGR01509 family)
MKALIFDFDGLIVDTELPDYISWQEVYQRHGVELPLEVWTIVVGGDSSAGFEPHEYLEELTGQPVDHDAIWIMRRKSYLEHLESQPVLPGVKTYLRSAKNMGMRLAIASSSPRSWVEGHLTRLGLRDYFEILCTADDVERVKPDPALFLLTARKLGIQPQEAIVFEDSLNGLIAAKKAGMFVVVVPNQLTEHLDLSQADIKLNSLADLSLKDLLVKAADYRQPSSAN